MSFIAKTRTFMDKNCLNKTIILIIGVLFILFSGWITGCGIGESIGYRCAGMKIGIGISMLVNGMLFIKIYFYEKQFENKQKLYKK